jgi:hypothetical protein
VQFSFDVYWESDAEHCFTRQEFAEGLADAPAPGSEIGKIRWDVRHLEPDVGGWRKHRETRDAHLAFRDFELARLGSEPEVSGREIDVGYRAQSGCDEQHGVVSALGPTPDILILAVSRIIGTG